MDFLYTILSSLVYDLIKTGAKLTYSAVFGNFYGNKMKRENGIYDEFIYKINEEKDEFNKQRTAASLLKTERIIATFEQELYNTNFAKRLDYIIYLINQNKSFDERINLEYIGEWLGFESVNELKEYYLDNKEPKYTFIENVAEKLGVNKEWLKHGTNLKPFRSVIQFKYEEGLLQIDCGKKLIFAIRKSESRSEILVIKEIDKLKYEVFPRPLVFHSQVGSEGRRQLYATYNFLKKVYIENQFCLNFVYFVPENVFNDLIEGKCYPGIVSEYSSDNKTWILFDFVESDRGESTKYLSDLYGDEFVAAKNIIKDFLSKEETDEKSSVDAF